MNIRAIIVEFFGALVLALFVGLTLLSNSPVMATPITAAVVLGFFVYTIGSISGAHINPAVTLGLLSIKKINVKDAVYYILAQILGGLVAFVLMRSISGVDTTMSQLAETSTRVALGEIVGMCMFAFGIASVVYGKVASHMNGIVVGISLLLGIMIASWIGSNGVLNPAVALGIGSFNLIYMLAPILGSILGFQAYNWLNKSQN